MIRISGFPHIFFQSEGLIISWFDFWYLLYYDLFDTTSVCYLMLYRHPYFFWCRWCTSPYLLRVFLLQFTFYRFVYFCVWNNKVIISRGFGLFLSRYRTTTVLLPIVTHPSSPLFLLYQRSFQISPENPYNYYYTNNYIYFRCI